MCCIYQDLLRKIKFVIHTLNVSRWRGLSQSQERGEGGTIRRGAVELTTVGVRTEKGGSLCRSTRPHLRSLRLKPFTQGTGAKIIPKREMAQQLLLRSQKGRLIYLNHLMKKHRLPPSLHYLPLHTQAPRPHSLCLPRNISLLCFDSAEHGSLFHIWLLNSKSSSVW